MHEVSTGPLERTWLGSALPEGSRQRLTSIGREYVAPVGAVLLREGEETRELGLVLSGRIGLSSDVPGRGSVSLLSVEPGDIFGWSAIIPPFRATSTVAVVERATIFALEASDLRTALHADAELAAVVYKQVLETVARRLIATRHQLYDLYRLEAFEPW